MQVRAVTAVGRLLLPSLFRCNFMLNCEWASGYSSNRTARLAPQIKYSPLLLARPILSPSTPTLLLQLLQGLPSSKPLARANILTQVSSRTLPNCKASFSCISFFHSPSFLLLLSSWAHSLSRPLCRVPHLARDAASLYCFIPSSGSLLRDKCTPLDRFELCYAHLTDPPRSYSYPHPFATQLRRSMSTPVVAERYDLTTP